MVLKAPEAEIKSDSTGRINMIFKHLGAFTVLLGLLGPLSLVSNMAMAQLLPRSTSSLSAQSQSIPMPLAQDEAFPFYVSEVSPGLLRVDWILAQGHYLYRHAFKFSMTGSATGDEEAETIAVDFILPEGLEKTDQFFGQIVAYYDTVSIDISLTTVPSPDSILIIEYQGCADWGFCYPPQRAEHRLIP